MRELRIDKRILEELFDAKFLCGSYHVKFINCCRDMIPGQMENITKSGTNVAKFVRKIFYTYD